MSHQAVYFWESQKTLLPVHCSLICGVITFNIKFIFLQISVRTLNKLISAQQQQQQPFYGPLLSSREPAMTTSASCFWMHATSTSLTTNASVNLPALHVNESTFQVPTQNLQPFHSLSAFRSSWTQSSALAQSYAAFWLGFLTLCLHRYVGVPMGDTQQSCLCMPSFGFYNICWYWAQMEQYFEVESFLSWWLLRYCDSCAGCWYYMHLNIWRISQYISNDAAAFENGIQCLIAEVCMMLWKIA